MSNTEQAELARKYLERHDILNVLHGALNHAVLTRADQPLVHIAKLLRNHTYSRGRAAAAPGDADAATTATAVATTTTAPPADPEAPPTPMPITTPTAERLQSVLRAAGVDLSLWGTTSALTIRHLWAQLGAREALLLREPGGALRLELRSVEVELHFRGRVLVETHREVDGRTHPRFALLSGRVRAAEPWRDAVARAVRGALRLDAAQYTVHHDGDGDDADAGGGGTGRPPPAESREFPGLPCAHETLRVAATVHEPPGAPAAGARRRRRRSRRSPPIASPPTARRAAAARRRCATTGRGTRRPSGRRCGGRPRRRRHGATRSPSSTPRSPRASSRAPTCDLTASARSRLSTTIWGRRRRRSACSARCTSARGRRSTT